MNSKSAGYPRFRLFTPNPPDYFFLGCSLTENMAFGIEYRGDKRAFDEFNIRWVPPVPLVHPQPAGLFFLGVFADEKKTADCIDASRLIFQSAVSFRTHPIDCRGGSGSYDPGGSRSMFTYMWLTKPTRTP